MRKKLLVVLGFGASLALAVAFAADKAQPASSPATVEKEAQKAAIAMEGKGASGQKPHDCCKKKSGSAQAQPSGDQNMASSGTDVPNSADCPKTDCDKNHAHKHSKAKAKAGAEEGSACEKPSGAESEI